MSEWKNRLGGGVGMFSFDLAIANLHKSLKKSLNKMFNDLAKEGKTKWGQKAQKATTKMGKAFDKFSKSIEKSKIAKTFTGIAKAGEAVGHVIMNSIGVFMQLADKMGILQPMFDIIGGIFSIIGGFAMESVGPALQEFAEVLFSPEMMEIWQLLGETIGEFLSTIMSSLATLFSDPAFQKVLKKFVDVITHVFTMIGMVLGFFFKILGDMSASDMGKLFFAMGTFFAFMKGMAHGGPAGAILGAAYFTLAAVALAPLLAMQHGGYIPATPGGVIVNVGEGGEGEFIVPESKMGGNEELVWATEDNGRRLDRLIGAMETSNRIKRLKYL